MEAELQQKHQEKSNAKKQIRSVDISFRISLNVIIYNCIIYQINIAAKSKFKVVLKGHLKKLDTFQKTNAVMGNKTKLSMYIKHTVYNFSSYVLSDEEYKALTYGLDHHIPTSPDYNAVETVFELF